VPRRNVLDSDAAGDVLRYAGLVYSPPRHRPPAQSVVIWWCSCGRAFATQKGRSSHFTKANRASGPGPRALPAQR